MSLRRKYLWQKQKYTDPQSIFQTAWSASIPLESPFTGFFHWQLLRFIYFLCAGLLFIFALIYSPFDCRICRVWDLCQYWTVLESLVFTDIQHLWNLAALLLVHHLAFIRRFENDNFPISNALFILRTFLLWLWNWLLKGIGHVRWVGPLAGWMHSTPLWRWLFFLFPLSLRSLLLLQESSKGIQILRVLIPLIQDSEKLLFILRAISLFIIIIMIHLLFLFFFIQNRIQTLAILILKTNLIHLSRYCLFFFLLRVLFGIRSWLLVFY
jgi:hypothetical protein